MTLGSELNTQFITETKKISVGNSNEEKLFNALNNAFENLSVKNNATCQVIHGAKHFVRFDEIIGYPAYYAKDRGKRVPCELADLLIVAVNRREMRVCCLQNKYEKQSIRMSITDSFKADMRQFYLLKMRPVFEKSGNNNSLLSDAICPSVGAYGVFYHDGNQFDMNYYSAIILDRLRSSSSGRKQSLKMNMDEPKCATRKNSCGGIVCEQQYGSNIIEFGDAVEKMLVGTPFSITDGLLSLQDINIFEAVARINDNMINDNLIAEMDNIRKIGTPAISYRAAIIIKGLEWNK